MTFGFFACFDFSKNHARSHAQIVTLVCLWQVCTAVQRYTQKANHRHVSPLFDMHTLFGVSLRPQQEEKACNNGQGQKHLSMSRWIGAQTKPRCVLVSGSICLMCILNSILHRHAKANMLACLDALKLLPVLMPETSQ